MKKKPTNVNIVSICIRDGKLIGIGTDNRIYHYADSTNEWFDQHPID